jgi:hypothetical protein
MKENGQAQELLDEEDSLKSLQSLKLNVSELDTKTISKKSKLTEIIEETMYEYELVPDEKEEYFDFLSLKDDFQVKFKFK